MSLANDLLMLEFGGESDLEQGQHLWPMCDYTVLIHQEEFTYVLAD